MVWTQEYQKYVLCDRPGEDSLWKDSLSKDYPNLDNHTRQTFFNIFDMYS